MRCEPSCTAYLFPHFCHRFAPPKTTSLPKKFFSFAVKRCIVLLECAAFCFLWEIFVICQQSLPLQFIPARGRKHQQQVRKHLTVKIAIYPREGTETPCRNCCYPWAWVAFIPMRGRKLSRFKPSFLVHLLQLIPARGRKPTTFPVRMTVDHNCNLSPRGDKKAPLPLAFASSGGALLFLIFYFTGWELRLPGLSL